MNENWLNENLCSFDEKVRIEKGPQIIDLPCDDEHLCDEKTHPNYHIGARDAFGRIIRPRESTNPRVAMIVEKDKRLNVFGVVNKGEIMAVVDWRSKFVPHVWKIYQSQDFEEITGNGDVVTVTRFVQVDETEDKGEAVSKAKSLAGGV